MFTIDSIIEQLRGNGHRITTARHRIVDTLFRSTRPQTATNILAHLDKVGTRVNKTTVYRELQFLVQQGIAVAVQLESGKTHYELERGDHHHHLRCISCDQIQDVELDKKIAPIEEQFSQKHQFQLLGHTIEFYGTCKDCV